MNLSSSGMISNFRQDSVTKQLSRSAYSGGKIFDPTSSAIKSNHETDKQAEENATWFFEYKALLNSKLTTLTTALTSAYTTDLDASMTKVDPALWGNKNAMQGITGTQRDLYPLPGGDGRPETSVIDPGAARTANAYFNTWGFNVGIVGVTPPSGYGSVNQAVYGDNNVEAATVSFGMELTGSNMSSGDYTNAANTLRLQGTTTFLSGGSSADKGLVLDRLTLNPPKFVANNDFLNQKSAAQIISSYPTTIEPGKDIGNNFELTLYKFFSRPENYDLIRFGFLDDLYVVGTSSLATGSQVQGSLSLRYNTDAGYLEIKQERYSCFFHS